MNRRSITLVILVVLCAFGFAYGQGWIHWSRTGAAIESNKSGVHHTLDQQKTEKDSVQVAPHGTEPATTPKE